MSVEGEEEEEVKQGDDHHSEEEDPFSFMTMEEKYSTSKYEKERHRLRRRIRNIE